MAARHNMHSRVAVQELLQAYYKFNSRIAPQ